MRERQGRDAPHAQRHVVAGAVHHGLRVRRALDAAHGVLVARERGQRDGGVAHVPQLDCFVHRALR